MMGWCYGILACFPGEVRGMTTKQVKAIAKKAPVDKDTKVRQGKVRLLLTVWMAGEEGLKRGDLTKSLKASGGDGVSGSALVPLLEKDGFLAFKAVKRAKWGTLTPEGVSFLDETLMDPGFEFVAPQFGSAFVNALLGWIRERRAAVSTVDANGHGSINGNGNGNGKAIASYEEFKEVAFQTYKQLNNGHSYSGLVPIWHLRQELEEKVDRLDFNDWLMKMQAERIFYLQTGEAIGATDEQKRNSLESEIRGLLFYVSQPN